MQDGASYVCMQKERVSFQSDTIDMKVRVVLVNRV